MLNINSHFCLQDDPKMVVDWGHRDAEIKTGDEVVFSFPNVEAPVSWSQTAVNIAASKYFTPMETSVFQLVDRVASTIANWGVGDGYFNPEDGRVFQKELTALLLTQRACFNSPVLFNLGLPGEGKPGGYTWSGEEVIPVVDSHINPQCSACFILGVKDDLKCIMEAATIQALIFKHGSGAGLNLSSLRSSREALSGGGTPSGPLSFARIYDATAEVVRSGGKTRRAAAMRLLDINHPDIIEFINSKEDVEKLARDLIAKGHDPVAVYSMLPFQNANHTVRISNEYMKANGPWHVKHVTSNTRTPIQDAGEIWELIAKRAHTCGDPGLQFSDTINKMNMLASEGEIVASNPCGEFLSLNESACNLASINLRKFQRLDGQLRVEEFKRAARIMFIAQDILIDRASYPTENICRNSHNYRQIGLGYSNLGSFLMDAKLPYDSDAGRARCAEITETLLCVALETSAEMASMLGAFSAYNQSDVNKVLDLHLESAKFEALPEAIDTAKYHGLRNSHLTCLAPTGTISLMMDCETMGIEPKLAHNSVKTLVGGGTIVQETNVDETDPVFATALGVNRIPWEAHIGMVAAAQPFLSGGVSKTINLPKDATVEDVKNAHTLAYNRGLKGITVYRDGSKGTQPVVVQNEGEPEIIVSKRRRLPDTRASITHKFVVDTHCGFLTVGLYPDGSPGEIFITVSKQGSTINGLLDSYGIAVSLGLQYGIPLKVFTDKFKHARFEPQGFTKHPNIRLAKSIVDYIARWLEIEFILEGMPEYPDVYEGVIEETGEAGMDTSLCTECGSFTTRVGACLFCQNCGTSEGCS